MHFPSITDPVKFKTHLAKVFAIFFAFELTKWDSKSQIQVDSKS